MGYVSIRKLSPRGHGVPSRATRRVRRGRLVGLGDMQDGTQLRHAQDPSWHRRIYRALFTASVVLAAIGAPVLMLGAVYCAQGMSSGMTARHGLAALALACTPLLLALVTWQGTQYLQSTLDDE